MKTTRRTLLLGGTLLAPAAFAAEPHRIGVIGCGNRSTAHWAAIQHLPEARVVALSDVRPEMSATFNQKLPQAAATYVDYRELIRDRNVGVVVIATPGYLHKEMALEALRAGKDLILEKPIATSYADALEIVKAAKASGRIVAVGMQRRYAAADRTTRETVESGAIGTVRLITFQEFRGDWAPQGWKYTDPATGKQTNWRMIAKLAGSTELEFSVHAFAEVTSLVKSPLVRLAASGGVVHYSGRDTRDLTTILAEFGNGMRLNYSFTCFAPGSGSSLAIVGDKGTLVRTQGKLTIQRPGKGVEPIAIPQQPPAESAEVQMYKQFFENVRTRTPSPIGPEVALEAAKIAYAADWSIGANRFVTERDFA